MGHPEKPVKPKEKVTTTSHPEKPVKK